MAGFVGKGWVGDCRPMHDDLRNRALFDRPYGLPVTRSNTNDMFCLVSKVTALIVLPSIVMSCKMGAAGGS